MVTFLVLVRPGILKLTGATDLELPAHPGVLAVPLVNRGDRRHFMRVRVDAAGQVRGRVAGFARGGAAWAGQCTGGCTAGNFAD